MAETAVASVRLLTKRVFDAAKRRWLLSVVVRIIVFVVSVLVLISPVHARAAAWIVAAAAIAAEIAALLADKKKAVAEWLLRQLDLHEGFGRPLPADEIGDLRVTLPRIAAEIDRATEAPAPYFASADDSIGPAHAIRNTQESAWRSKHLAYMMYGWYTLAFGLLVAVGGISVLVAIETVKRAATLDTVARIAITVIVFAFSATVGRQAFGYKAFRDGAETCEKKAAKLLEQADIPMLEACALMAEYHLRRATSPLIPNSVHERHRVRLDEEWRRRAAR